MGVFVFFFQPRPKQQAIDASVPDNSWQQGGDCATLIENEFWNWRTFLYSLIRFSKLFFNRFYFQLYIPYIVRWMILYRQCCTYKMRFIASTKLWVKLIKLFTSTWQWQHVSFFIWFNCWIQLLVKHISYNAIVYHTIISLTRRKHF